MQQTQLQLQQHLQLHHHQHAASVVDYSNSPASPMASPTGGGSSSFTEQQQSPTEGVGSEMLHQKAAMEDFRGLLETAVNDSRGGHSTLTCFNDKLAKAPRLKFLQEGWQMHNFFGEQPKSPTETPPDMEDTMMSVMTSTMERVENRAEMKNLATLCSAAAMAAAATSGTADMESDEGDAEGEENTLPPEPIELTDTIIEEEEVDDEDDDDEEQDTQSGEIEKIEITYDDDDADADVDYVDEDDVGDDDDEDDDDFFLDVNVVVGDQSDTNSKNGAALPPKQRKMSTRLENLILTKPDMLTHSICDFRQDMPNSELMLNNAALNTLLQQQLAAATAASVHAKANNEQSDQCGKLLNLCIL